MKKILPLVLLSLLFILIDSCSKDDIKVYELTTSASPSEGGSVSPASGSYVSGEEVSITATASSGYTFKNWSGSITGTTNPVKMNMNSDKEVIAIFEMPDADNDGVTDSLDQCPNTPSGEDVDDSGCSTSDKDSDGDGVEDTTDICPDTPEGETVGDDGCSDSQKDSDGDGISDDIDICAETPEGEEVDEFGCSASQSDSDEDTIPDNIDQCPDTPAGEVVDEFGCSPSQKDTDGDGVTDDLDKCQNTPEGETVDATGCSDTQVDTDGDTITDDLDQCPDTPEGEAIDEQGCSESQKDDDGDGINNLLDECPDTPDGEGVNSIGCSTSQEDTDGDSVTDNIDQCPGTPDGETADAEGCSDSQKDTDVDGVSDDLDECPDTPSGETVDSNGCADNQKDTDEDGVTNDIDQCPDTPNGESVNAQGCSTSQIDSDEDSVFDNADQCPDTPSGETVDVQGCSDSQKDTDGDGVYDDKDQCPDTASGVTVDETGCEIVSKTYVPDDLFEQNLIDLGYDDVLDDYVLTDNIKNVTSLVLMRFGGYGYEPFTIYDFTGIQDFVALEELEFRYMEPIDNLDLSNNLNLKKLVFRCSIVGDINIKNNIALEELAIIASFDLSSCYAFWTSDWDLSGNINLKTLGLGNVIGPGDQLDAILASVPSIEVLSYSFIGILGESLDLRSNVNLKTLHIVTESYIEDLLINLRNGANNLLEEIYLSTQLSISNVCIQVDDPTYVENIVYAETSNDPDYIDYTVTTDCSGSAIASKTSSERFFSQTELEEYEKRLEETKKKIKEFNALKNEFINSLEK